MTESSSPRLNVVAYIPFSNAKEFTFALPLLADLQTAGTLFVQEVDEHLNVILSFKMLTDDLSSAIFFSSGPVVQKGDELIHVFVGEFQAVHAGTLSEIEPILRTFVQEHPNRKATCLQVIELIGNSTEKRYQKKRMRDEISKTAGVEAAVRFYEGSALRVALWNRLLAAAPDEYSAERILQARTSLRPTMDASGKISLDLGSLNSQDYAGITSEQLIAELETEFDPSSFAEQPPTVEDGSSLSPSLVTIDISHALERLSMASRQEERAAILMEEFLEDPAVGEALLLRYKDRAQFANQVFDYVRHNLSARRTSDPPRFQGENAQRHNEMLIAKVIDRLSNESFPYNRGLVLLYMAKHLAKYPLINQAIDASVKRANAFSVYQHKSSIEGFLGTGSSSPNL